MAFSLSFAGVQVSLNVISPQSSDDNAFCIKGVRHCDDGRIEADVCNFSGTIILSEAPPEPVKREESSESSEDLTNHEQEQKNISRDIVLVNAIPEHECGPCTKIFKAASSYIKPNSNEVDLPVPYVPPKPHLYPRLSVEIDSGDDSDTVFFDSGDDAGENSASPASNTNGTGGGGGRVQFDLNNVQIMQEDKPKVDLTLHKACASEDSEIEDLRAILRSKPELASVQDEFGDYAAHVFANNDAFIYTSSDYEVQEFVFELYTAHPSAFLTSGYDGQIPFAGAIVDWVDDCHVLYAMDTNSKEVFRVSEIKTLTRSTHVINSLCVREEVQKLTNLPTDVKVTTKVMYSFKMLSFVLDTLSRMALEDISTRKEFWAVSSKRRDKIIQSMASLPFLVRTILLIENKAERDELLNLSIVKNLVFRPESVDLWLVALMSGDDRAQNCAVDYLCLISRSSLSGLFGRRLKWSEADSSRFHSMRKDLYAEVAKLSGFLPCLLHLGDKLNSVAPRRAVKYAVESAIGRPLPVYLQLMEMILLLILMTSYRIIVELVYAHPSQEFLSNYREFWGLALSVTCYFAGRDLAILISFSGTEERLAWKYMSNFSNFVGYMTTISTLVVLSVLYVNSSFAGRQYAGLVMGLLWWKFLLHMKGMSESLSTLIYTIVQIAVTLKYFLAIFLIGIFFFADMVDIVKKASGECENIDDDIDGDLDTFCSLTPLETYLSMYSVMIGGFEISSLEASSALVCLLFVAASFSGVIVLVNILIAIVTGEYEKAQEVSCIHFARSRLEAAARQVARETIADPPEDPTSGTGRKIWRKTNKLKYAGFLAVIEYFLVMSLISVSKLHREAERFGDFLYVALITCAVLLHMFIVAAAIYLVARSICRYECLRWLRGSKFHRFLLNLSLKPICKYLSSIGLGEGEKCPDASDYELQNHPLSHNEFLVKQADFENNIQEAIKASETRILHAVKSLMFQMPPEAATEAWSGS